MRVLYFGTYERDYPRNAQVISCLRRAGVEVRRAARRGLGRAPRQLERGRRCRGAARRWPSSAAAPADRPTSTRSSSATRATSTCRPRGAPRDGRPVVFNPLVSLVGHVRRRPRPLPRRAPSRRGRSRPSTGTRSARPTSSSPTRSASADHLAELAGLPRERVEVASSAPRSGVFAPGWSPAEPFTVLFVGKLIPLHGLETILAAARAAPELRFRLVGSGQLEALVRERPGERRAGSRGSSTSGCRTSSTARAARSGSSAPPTKARRVIPNKAFQALACGTPLVTADTPGARELLVDGESALLVPPGDAEALAAALRRLAARPGAGAAPLRRRPRRLRGAARARTCSAAAGASWSSRRSRARDPARARCSGRRSPPTRPASRRSRSCATAPSRPAASTSATWCRRSGRRRTATRCRSPACAATRSRGSARTSTRSSPPSRRSGWSGRARTCCSSTQAVAVALGALPVYWLARKHLGSERAGARLRARLPRSTRRPSG